MLWIWIFFPFRLQGSLKHRILNTASLLLVENDILDKRTVFRIPDALNPDQGILLNPKPGSRLDGIRIKANDDSNVGTAMLKQMI